MINKRLNTGEQFSEALEYLKETKNYILLAIILFFSSSLFGYLFSSRLGFLDELLKDLVLKTEGLNTPQLIFFILQNNLQSALISALAGIFFGLIPIANAIINGTVLGYVLSLTAQKEGFLVWWRLLPHGIFELPAIFISLGLGIKLGFSLLKREDRSETLRERFYKTANTFLMIVIPLLIIAAFIEGILIGIFR